MRINWKWCWWKGSLIRPPYAIMFRASCVIHDRQYKIWWLESDRKRADIWLAKYMWKDVRKQPKYKQPYFYIWVFIYYKAVRIFWSKYFNYK